MRYRGLGLVLLLGLAVRLWAMRWPPFPNDMVAWIAWGERMLAVGPGRFYDPSVFADYAPGYLYVTWLTAALKNALLPDAGLGTYHFLYRLTPILFDLATGVLIFAFVRRALGSRADERGDDVAGGVPLFAAACHVFNPAIIFNSATWSQIDGVFTFWMLLALALLLRGRAEWAVASYVVAFLIKPQAISLAPVIGLVLLLRFPPRRWLTAGAIGIGLAYLVMLPFFGLNAFGRLIGVLQGSVDVYPYTSLFTYNLWGIYGFWKDDTVRSSLGPSLRTLGTLLYLLGLAYGSLLCVWQLRRTRDDALTLFAFAIYFTFLPVMVLTRMHERYLYPVLPLLLIGALLYVRRGRSAPHAIRPYALSAPFGLYGALTLLHTLNLYQVYLYYQYRERGGVPRSNALFYFIDDHPRIWSALTLLIFAIVALWLLQRTLRHQTRTLPTPERRAEGELVG